MRGFGSRRKRNEVAQNLTSYRDGWYYDSFTVAAGAAFPVTNMFATAKGAGGKTLANTNLTGQGGQLPAGQTLLIRSIRIYITNTTVPADFQNILSNCSVQFLVDNVPIYQNTPGWFPAGYGGITTAVANVGVLPAGTAVVASTTNGLPLQTAVYDFKFPYSLESQLNFTVLWTPETAFNMVAARMGRRNRESFGGLLHELEFPTGRVFAEWLRQPAQPVAATDSIRTPRSLPCARCARAAGNSTIRDGNLLTRWARSR